MASSASGSKTISSRSSSSIVNVARIIFIISIGLLASYIYAIFSAELTAYASFKSSRQVLSSISSAAFGESTYSPSTSTPSSSAVSTVAPSTDTSSAAMAGVARIPNDIFQYSLHSALRRGLTSGGPPAARLTGYGTHGIGQVGGSLHDLVLLDAVPYELADGVAKRVSDVQLPFVMVTKYEPEYRVRPSSTVKFSSLREVFALPGPESGASGKNGYVPFSVSGAFSEVKVAGGKSLGATKGTIFGIASPDWAGEVSYKGIHCSFLSQDKSTGGKVEDFVGEGGALTVEWAVTGRFHLGFPHDPEWHEMDLSA